MWKIAALVWIMLGTTLAGIAMIVVTSVPELAGQAMTLIPILCGAGFLLALPMSVAIAKKIQAQARTAA